MSKRGIHRSITSKPISTHTMTMMNIVVVLQSKPSGPAKTLDKKTNHTKIHKFIATLQSPIFNQSATIRHIYCSMAKIVKQIFPSQSPPMKMFRTDHSCHRRRRRPHCGKAKVEEDAGSAMLPRVPNGKDGVVNGEKVTENQRKAERPQLRRPQRFAYHHAMNISAVLAVQHSGSDRLKC
jgi:hypothetical protein